MLDYIKVIDTHPGKGALFQGQCALFMPLKAALSQACRTLGRAPGVRQQGVMPR